MEEIKIVSDYPHYLNCPICLELAKDPVEHFVCDGIFCRECLSQTNRCPMCRDLLTDRNVKRLNRHLKNDIYDEIQIRCPNYSRGCHQICTLTNCSIHRDTCSFELIKCGIGGCQEEQLRAGMALHQQFCPNRSIQCPYCTTSIKAPHMKVHIRRCLFHPNLRIYRLSTIIKYLQLLLVITILLMAIIMLMWNEIDCELEPIFVLPILIGMVP